MNEELTLSDLVYTVHYAKDENSYAICGSRPSWGHYHGNPEQFLALSEEGTFRCQGSALLERTCKRCTKKLRKDYDLYSM